MVVVKTKWHDYSECGLIYTSLIVIVTKFSIDGSALHPLWEWSTSVVGVVYINVVIDLHF